MSRLVVKNLPKNVNENKLKQLFSEKGVVTDLQLKYTEDGKFRRFGFVGFKNKEQAEATLNYFNNTCIDTCKITLEYCSKLGDSNKPKSWSKYASDSNANKLREAQTEKAKTEKKGGKGDKNGHAEEAEDGKAGKSKSKKKGNKERDKNELSDNVKDILKKHVDDPMFAEFMEGHVKGEKKIWSNDILLSLKNDEESPVDGKINTDEEKESDDNHSSCDEPIAKKDITDKEYMQALKNKQKIVQSEENTKSAKNHGPHKFFTVKVQGLAYNHKKKDIKKFFKGIKAKSIRVPSKIKGIAYVGFKTERLLKFALNKNKCFLDGKRLCVSKYEKVENVNPNIGKKPNLRWKDQEEALKNEESIAESGRIYLRNLTYTVTEDDITNLFKKYGPLTEVNLPIDKITRKPKGFGTVTFLMPEHAVKAYTELDGSILDGRMLHLLSAKSKTTPEDLLLQEGLDFKQKKYLQAKSTAGSSHNWNTLFLGHNAVADAIANTYNTTKENVLQDNDTGASMAVRLALGETQIVQETQKFLEENGVHLNAFNQAPSKRSKNIILVKNLPAGTHIKELRQLFSQHGELGRLILPPSGITALVEYIEPSEARKAFTRLAYSKFKHLPLYLEWAPDDSLKPSVAKATSDETKNNATEGASENLKSKTNKSNAEGEEKATAVENKEDEEEEDDEDEPEADTTIFVKNLNFATTEEQLSKYFSKCGRLHYANITMKKDPKNPSNKLSMGYGFVRYKLKADADRALKELQMRSFDGKSLELKRSERTLSTDVNTARKKANVSEQTGTVILVKNIPFQAKTDEVKDLFKAFGEIKSVRLPKKVVGEEKHRGFGFVEFYTKKEAKRAFKALCQSTHLYGRRLVLEWAQSQENLEELRKRTAMHYHEEPSAKRSKKGTLDPETVGLKVN